MRPLTSCEENILFIDAHGIDDGIVALKVLHESTLGTLPLFDAACATTGKGKL